MIGTWFGALCSFGVAGWGGVSLGLFVAGVSGSVMHCAPMCGGVVLGQVADRLAAIPRQRLCEMQRVRNGLLIPYHLGRLTTYTALGASMAGSLAAFGHLAWFDRLSAVLLAIAATLFLARALRPILRRRAFNARPYSAPDRWARAIGRFARRIPRGSACGEFGLGVTLGFLPCGFLYAALAAAAASEHPASGAAAMLAFGLGTVPVLLIIGVGGQTAGRRWQRGVAAAAPLLMALNALLMLTLAWQRLA